MFNWIAKAFAWTFLPLTWGVAGGRKVFVWNMKHGNINIQYTSGKHACSIPKTKTKTTKTIRSRPTHALSIHDGTQAKQKIGNHSKNESNRIWKRNSFDDSEVMPLFRVWIYRICSGNSFTHRIIFVGMKPRNEFKQKLCEHLLIHLDKSGNKNKQKPGQTTPKTIRFSRWHILLYLDYKLEINNSVRERKLNETQIGKAFKIWAMAAVSIVFSVCTEQ